MPTRVKPGYGKRYLERATQSRDSYLDGVRSPRRPWAKATRDAADAWKSGVIAAANDGRYAAGVTADAETRWEDHAVNVGADRFVQGVQLAEDRYTQGVQPYLDVIEKLDLPKRYAAGDSRNIERVRAVTEALHKKKTGKS
jgi:hypothetical protein